jgi:ankyrin repeat protein
MRTTISVLLVTSLLAALPLLADDNTAQADFLKAVATRDLPTVQAMLERDPALANARRPNGMSAVSVALFSIGKGEKAFHDAATNEVLKAVMARSPRLDLFDTAALGTGAELEALLAADPARLTQRSPFGWTLLHLSAFSGNTANTELLLRKGAAIETRAESKFRNTPLQAALLSGQYATAKILLDHGADPLVRQSKGATPMHEAALIGRQDLVQLLLDRGAEINSVSDNGQTPLAEAMRGHQDELAAWMKTKGAVSGVQPDEEITRK